MTVIVGSRKPYTLISDIEKLNYKGKVVHIPLDLGSLKSVREFAALVNENYKSIDILVNNAAIVFDDSYNEDGIDTTLCTNYAGHFLLTHLLLDNLKKGGQEGNVMSRIVNVSSCAHKLMNLDLNDLKFSKFRYNYLVYGRTKLAQVRNNIKLFTSTSLFAKHVQNANNKRT